MIFVTIHAIDGMPAGNMGPFTGVAQATQYAYAKAEVGGGWIIWQQMGGAMVPQYSGIKE